MIERESILAFKADHPAFAGHFPARPIVPGVLLLDSALHLLSLKTGCRVTGIASAKFLQPVGPGERLAVTWDSGSGCRFEITNGGQRVASGALLLEPSAHAPDATVTHER